MPQNTIWKFPFVTDDKQVISMPKDRTIRCVDTQHGNPCIWAQVNPDSPKENVTFVIYGTGHIITRPDINYIGTYQELGGSLVWHVFEVIK